MKPQDIKMKRLIFLAITCLTVTYVKGQCIASVTRVGGTHAPGTVCAGELLFEDNFDSFDSAKWKNENSLWGGGNHEFQWYSPHPDNTFTRNGNLHLHPTLTSEMFGEDFVWNGRATIPANECTNPENNGCDRQAGGGNNIINPIRSSLVTTWDSFYFTYGHVEIRAKMPCGDWIWPALWFMPRHSVYGGWPRSGEIDLVELRSNRRLFNGDINVGAHQAGSTLHFGPTEDTNGASTAHGTRNQDIAYCDNFHNYRLIWHPQYIQFQIDGNVITTIDAGNGLFQRGGWEGSGLPNIWAGNGPLAPFDQDFYIIMNNAVGGTNHFFPDQFRNEPYVKPWSNQSPRASAEFWEARNLWEGTWARGSDQSDLKVDYVRVWAM